jgi:hypothetical protein
MTKLEAYRYAEKGFKVLMLSTVADPGSGAFLTPEDSDQASGSGMNLPDHISES